jgi:hypothetical protein
MALLYGRAGCLTARFGGVRPGKEVSRLLRSQAGKLGIASGQLGPARRPGTGELAGHGRLADPLLFAALCQAAAGGASMSLSTDIHPNVLNNIYVYMCL